MADFAYKITINRARSNLTLHRRSQDHPVRYWSQQNRPVPHQARPTHTSPTEAGYATGIANFCD